MAKQVLILYARHEAQLVVLSVQSSTLLCLGVRAEFPWGVVLLLLVCACEIFAAVEMFFVGINLLRLVLGDPHQRGWPPLSLLHSLVSPQTLR